MGGQRGAHFSRGKSLTLGKRTIMKCSERKLHSTYGGSRWSTIRRCGPCLGFRRNSCTALGCARPAGTTASLSDAPACERARNSWRRGSRAREVAGVRQPAGQDGDTSRILCRRVCWKLDPVHRPRRKGELSIIRLAGLPSHSRGSPPAPPLALLVLVALARSAVKTTGHRPGFPFRTPPTSPKWPLTPVQSSTTCTVPPLPSLRRPSPRHEGGRRSASGTVRVTP